MENTDAPVNEAPETYEAPVAPAPEAPAADAPVAPAADAPAEGTYNQTNVIAFSVLAYIAILWLLGLLIPPENNSSIVKNHVNNGILLFGAEIVTGILYLIPVVGRWVLGPLLSIVILVFAVLGIVKAVKGEKYTLPIIGDKVTLIK